jgi:type IV secretion system protein VirB9
MRMIAAFFLLLCCALPLAAEITPLAGPGDPHIQTVAYDPNEVVALKFASGFALTVQFSPDEQIETVILGDNNSWVTQASRRADHLVVQPRGASQSTNMTVFTTQRTYNFMLYNNGGGQGVQPFLVSFTYPSAVTSSPVTYPVFGRYKLSGDKRLWPFEIGDDGQATTIRWDEGVTLPAVYRVDDQGDPALVNGVMRDGSYILDAVYPRLILIRGKSRARAIRETAKP